MNSNTKGISEKWKGIANTWLGIEDGKHCHWCSFVKHDEGCSYCYNKESRFYDGKRIRGWDGIYCADKCGKFQLDVNYTTDETYYEYFNIKKDNK